MPFPVPEHEEKRLEALRRYEILDTPPEEVFDRFTRLASAALDMPIALISLVDKGRQWFKAKQGTTAEQTPRDIAFCAHAICGQNVMIIPDATQDPRFADNPMVTGDPHIRFYAGAPLRTHDGYNIGVLCVKDRQPRELSPADRMVLVDLAAMVVDEIELRLAGRSAVKELLEKDELAREFKRLASTDPLTGVLNRRAFMDIAEKEFLRAKRYDRPLSILMMDVDHFKRINDRHGHAMGDRVLKALADETQACIRTHDVLGRLGGEEFAILVPETGEEEPSVIAHRIRERLAGLSIPTPRGPLGVTASIGVAACSRVTSSFDEMLSIADSALYLAKDGGRNRVECQDCSRANECWGALTPLA